MEAFARMRLEAGSGLPARFVVELPRFPRAGFDICGAPSMLATMRFDPEIIGRITLGLMFVGAAAIGLPHRLRADRTGGRVSVRVDPPWFWILMSLVGLPLTLACIAFLIHPSWVRFAEFELPAFLRMLGVPVGVAGLALFHWMFRHLGLNITSTSMPRRNATLVTTGPYHWIRHPMYSAALLLVIAALLLTANLVVAGGGLGMFTLLAARSRLEEKRLLEKFGDAYRQYQYRTGRFLPRWGKP